MDRQVSSPKCRLVLIALASAREQLHLMLAAELRCRCIISVQDLPPASSLLGFTDPCSAYGLPTRCVECCSAALPGRDAQSADSITVEKLTDVVMMMCVVAILIIVSTQDCAMYT